MGGAVSVHAREPKSRPNRFERAITRVWECDSHGDPEDVRCDSSFESVAKNEEDSTDSHSICSQDSVKQDVDLSHESSSSSIRLFKFQELKKTTNNFATDHILGRGGFGTVYKGWLKTRSSAPPLPVAIKKLHQGSIQGQNEWISEILILSRIHHENLVKLYGYCFEHEEHLLIYEFVHMGSLDYHLFPVHKNDYNLPSGLTFKIRLKIALDMAKGLAYLHERKIVHRDFKSANVLLDENFNAKLTDFGLAKMVDPKASNASTLVMGTLGYLDPEYFETGRLSFRSDVYSFGIMLLELLTGRRAVDRLSKQPLSEWAKPFLISKNPDLDSLIDPILKDQIASESALKVALTTTVIAKYCIHEEANYRPTMKEIIYSIGELLKRFNYLDDEI